MHSSSFRKLIACAAVVAVALVGSVLTAQPSAKPAPQKPKPIVTITKLDKTTVRGQLSSAEPDQLVVKTPGAAGETVTVRWSQIAKVSNGLTQDEAAEQWKAQFTKEQLCPDCGGDRGIACTDCRGTGHDQAKLVDCNDCGGGGVLFCPNKRCDEGKVDCPMPCLKLTEGRWTGPPGSRKRTFPGGAWVSEGHLGEVWTVKGGQPTSTGKCTNCEGTTKVDCKDCAGMIYKICPTCHFEGKTGPACPASMCERGRTPCSTCGATGLKKAA
jgi:hypothetical protein